MDKIERQKEIERILARQYKRCEDYLLEANCPKVFIDCVSKYFNFAKIDILNLENGEVDDRKFNK